MGRELSWLDIENIKRKLRNKARLRVKNQRDWTDGKGVITRSLDKHDGTITHEREVEALSRKEVDLRPELLFPDPYKDKIKCNECQIYLYACNFSPDRRNLNGLHGTCKTCRAKMRRENYKPVKHKRKHK